MELFSSLNYFLIFILILNTCSGVRLVCPALVGIIGLRCFFLYPSFQMLRFHSPCTGHFKSSYLTPCYHPVKGWYADRQFGAYIFFSEQGFYVGGHNAKSFLFPLR